jgi:hypothetical protein
MIQSKVANAPKQLDHGARCLKGLEFAPLAQDVL